MVWMELSVVFSRFRRFASVTVGIPMDPNGVGTPLAIRHNRHAISGSKPSPTSMLAGMATAVPKPAMPSMKPPKHHAIIRARILASEDTDERRRLMTSIAPVLRDRL